MYRVIQLRESTDLMNLFPTKSSIITFNMKKPCQRYAKINTVDIKLKNVAMPQKRNQAQVLNKLNIIDKVLLRNRNKIKFLNKNISQDKFLGKVKGNPRQRNKNKPQKLNSNIDKSSNVLNSQVKSFKESRENKIIFQKYPTQRSKGKH